MIQAEQLAEAPEIRDETPVAPRTYTAAPEVRRRERLTWRCPTELDARGRVPPSPLDAIRGAVADLKPGEVVWLRTKSEPDGLLADLARNGLPATARRLPDESWRTEIRCV